MKHTVVLLLALLTLGAYAQDDNVTKSQLASKYFFNKEYGKAAGLYEELYEQNYSKVYFNRYLKCLQELERFTDAKKLAQKQIKRQPDDYTYYVDLGMIYEKLNNYEQAESTYNKAIEKIPPSKNRIVNLGNAFVAHGRYEYAERLYKKAADMLKENAFHFQLASVYMMQRKYDEMAGEYLDLLQSNPGRLDDVQNRLQYIADNETTGDVHDILRRALLSRIRDEPSVGVYYQMLIWLYEQQKDFERALRQAKAIDRRTERQGREVYKVANLAKSNNAYDVAEDGYRYIMEQGQGKPFYWPARIRLLDVIFQRLTEGRIPSRKELQKIEADYTSAVSELNRGNRRVEMLRKLAHIQAFYLDDNNKALSTIEKALEGANISEGLLAECQLEKADILVKQGNVWDAALLYAKIEKDNKNNPNGYEAKFRKARLAYFTGDFEWAKAQLDVLKASTSKLIANDAFKLAELIDDNMQEDTAALGLKLYARADLKFWQHKDSAALRTLDSLRTLYPQHSLTDEVFYQKANFYKSRGAYKQAVKFYEKTFQEYSRDIYGDDALFELATIYENHLDELGKARELYRKVLEDYPGSIYVAESRKRFRKLRGDL